MYQNLGFGLIRTLKHERYKHTQTQVHMLLKEIKKKCLQGIGMLNISFKGFDGFSVGRFVGLFLPHSSFVLTLLCSFPDRKGQPTQMTKGKLF